MSKEHPLRQKIARALEHLETSARAFTVAGNAILSMSDSIQKDGIWGAMQPAQSNSPATASLQQPVPLRKERSTSRKVVEKRTLLHMHLQTAMQLASLLLLIVGVFYLLERNNRGEQIYSSKNSTFSPNIEQKLTGLKASLAFLICFTPIFIGFLVPIIKLGMWAYEVNVEFFNSKFISTSFNTLVLSLVTGLICASLALLINFSIRYKPHRAINKLSSLLSMGYAVPGLILAVGIVQLFVYLDSSFLSSIDLVLTGSIFGLILAYLIKSFALANSSIESGYERINNNLDDSSKLLGIIGWRMLSKVHFPLLKTSIFTSILLVMSEVVKELPATLILRPFNFETLAVSTYIYASEERMIQAAAPALAIVLTGLIPILFLSKMIRSSRPV